MISKNRVFFPKKIEPDFDDEGDDSLFYFDIPPVLGSNKSYKRRVQKRNVYEMNVFLRQKARHAAKLKRKQEKWKREQKKRRVTPESSKNKLLAERTKLMRERQMISKANEIEMGSILTWMGIGFYTEEEQIKLLHNFSTPDFLLCNPITVLHHKIWWIEVKDTIQKIQAHAGQVEKYENEFGFGMLVYWRSNSPNPFVRHNTLVVSRKFIWENIWESFRPEIFKKST